MQKWPFYCIYTRMLKNYRLNSPKNSSSAFGIPDLAIIFGCTCWGLNFVITKSAAGNDPEQFRTFIYNIIRFPAAVMLLMVTAWLKGQTIVIHRRDLRSIALLAIIGIFMYQIFYITGQT
ncbi:MAG TPA: EamA family transporter, partial [bacterium]|nr:EamA family transporter [bacterium]